MCSLYVSYISNKAVDVPVMADRLGVPPSTTGNVNMISAIAANAEMRPDALTSIPSERHSKFPLLLDLGYELALHGARVGSGLESEVRAAIGDLMRRLNCYYSVHIEDVRLNPDDTARALRYEMAEDDVIRFKQQRVLGYFKAQKSIDERTLLVDGSPSRQMKALHKMLLSNVETGGLIATRDDGRQIPMVPGEFRNWDRDFPRRTVRAINIPDFMRRMDKIYASPGGRLVPVAIASAHHRALLIRPFADENGPVTRLWSHLQLIQAGLSNGLWSLARGISIGRERYAATLGEADKEPLSMHDGRGATSDDGLTAFCAFFLESAVSQAKAMGSMFENAAIRRRLAAYVENEAREGRLDRRTGALIEKLVVFGRMPKAALGEAMGLELRHAQRLTDPLRKSGLLVSENQKAPMTLAFPLDLAEEVFPGLMARSDAFQSTPALALAI